MNKIAFIFFSVVLSAPTFSYSQDNLTQKIKISNDFYLDSVIARQQYRDHLNKLDSVKTYYKSGELDEVFHYNKGKLNGFSYRLNRSGDTITVWTFKNDYLRKRKNLKNYTNNRSDKKIKKVLKELIFLNLDVKDNPEKLSSRYKLASRQLYLGNRILAEKNLVHIENTFKKIKDTEPIPKKIEASLYDKLGQLYSSYENLDYAMHYRLKALKISPEESRLHYNLGQSLVYFKYHDTAIKYLEEAIIMVPGHSYANWALAVSYIDLEDYDTALKHLDIVKKNQDKLYKNMDIEQEKDPLTLSGYAYFKTNNLKKAEADLNEALTKNETNSLALMYMGLLQHKKGNTAKACENFQQAKKLGYEKTHDNKDLENNISSICENKKIEQNLENKTAKYVMAIVGPTEKGFMLDNTKNRNYSVSLYSYESKFLLKPEIKDGFVDLSQLKPSFYNLVFSNANSIQIIKIIRE